MGYKLYWCVCVLCIYVTLIEIATARRVRHWRSRSRPVNLVRDMDVEGFLKEFGYMDGIPAGIVGDSLRDVGDRDKQVQQAIKEFQSFYGLRQTGEADRETMKWMKTPRCGIADSADFNRRKRSFPSRYTHLGTKWDKKQLTWKLTRPTHKLPRDDQKRTIRKAFQIWENVVPLRITETSGKADMDIFFARGEHGDGNGNAFDGKSRVLAHAFGPPSFAGNPIGGDAHFDNDEDWSLSADKGSDFYVVAAHEFGHSLGLGHSQDRKALMFPAYQSQEDLQLGYDDISAIQLLYGRRETGGYTISPRTRRPDPRTRRPNPRTQRPNPRTQRPYSPRTTPAPRATTTKEGPPQPCNIDFDAIVEGPRPFYYAMRKGMVFKFTEEGIDPEYPKIMSEVFEDAPSEIDLAFSIGRKSKIYIIKENRIWRYTNMKLDKDYPLEFNRKSFPEKPQFAISLVDDRGSARVILFGKRNWWFYDFDSTAAISTTPQRYTINDRSWRGLPSGVRYSVRWRDNNYYLVTANSHVKFDHNRRRASAEGEVGGLPPWLARTCDAITASSSGNQRTFSLATIATVIITLLMTWR